MSLFDNFAPLDDLIQVIYYSTYCFVFLSRVQRSCWTAELGLVGEGGQWWRGSWTEQDVYKNAGSQVTDKALESFAARLARWIIEGEITIEDWKPDQGAEIKLQINPTGKAPVVLDLVELPRAEASVRAVMILKGIALQAQSHQCRINAPAPMERAPSPPDMKPSKAIVSKETEELEKAQKRIKRLEGEVIQLEARKAASETANTSPSKPAAPKPPPGASRVNPTRKKRKIVQAEFESD